MRRGDSGVNVSTISYARRICADKKLQYNKLKYVYMSANNCCVWNYTTCKSTVYE